MNYNDLYVNAHYKCLVSYHSLENGTQAVFVYSQTLHDLCIAKVSKIIKLAKIVKSTKNSADCLCNKICKTTQATLLLLYLNNALNVSRILMIRED